MLTIKVYCLPLDWGEDRLNDLHANIVAAVCGIEELGLKGEDEMMVLFLPDLMKYGLGKQVLIEIDDCPVFSSTQVQFTLNRTLAQAVGVAVRGLLASTEVSCRVREPSPNDAVWNSE